MSFVVRVKDFNSAVDFCLNSVGKDKERPLTSKLHIVVSKDGCYMESCNGVTLLRYAFPVIHEGEEFDFAIAPVKYTGKGDDSTLSFSVRDGGSVECIRDGLAGEKVNEVVSRLSEKYYNLNAMIEKLSDCTRVQYRFDPKVLIKGLRGFAKEEHVDLYIPSDTKAPWFINDSEEDDLLGVIMPMRIDDDNSTS